MVGALDVHRSSSSSEFKSVGAMMSNKAIASYRRCRVCDGHACRPHIFVKSSAAHKLSVSETTDEISRQNFRSVVISDSIQLSSGRQVDDSITGTRTTAMRVAEICSQPSLCDKQ